ncbi:MAG: trypsin-like serine protease [Kofleriaceae bacterium]|nr:trypsin-like serine protease [Kofleriaceae bacterium]
MSTELRHCSTTSTPTLSKILSLGLSLGLACVCACAPEAQDRNPAISQSQEPLIGGDVTDGDPAVVALLLGSNRSFCTGTLISPTVILTAAHCIDDLGNDPNARIFFGGDTRGTGQTFSVRAKKQHPMWTGNLANGHDVGMLVMDFPHPNPDIAKVLNTSPISEHIAEPYRHVGFGVYDRETGAADGQKRTGTVSITSTQGDAIISGTSQISVCFGDSGGPAFLTIDGQEVVAGIHSFTSGSECFPPNGDTDVQKYAEEFILPWVQENDPSCALDGICGKIGCSDDPDCQPCGPDGTCTENCELPDPDCSVVAVGGICRANSQCTSDICVALRTDPDYRYRSEACDLGGDTCADGMTCKSSAPFGDICVFDGDPPGILGDTCDIPAECGSYQCADNACVVPCNVGAGLLCPEKFDCDTRDDGANFYCFAPPSESGGCQVSSAGSQNGWLLGFAILLLWVRRRRNSAKYLSV